MKYSSTVAWLMLRLPGLTEEEATYFVDLARGETGEDRPAMLVETVDDTGAVHSVTLTEIRTTARQEEESYCPDCGRKVRPHALIELRLCRPCFTLRMFAEDMTRD